MTDEELFDLAKTGDEAAAQALAEQYAASVFSFLARLLGEQKALEAIRLLPSSVRPAESGFRVALWRAACAAGAAGTPSHEKGPSLHEHKALHLALEGKLVIEEIAAVLDLPVEQVENELLSSMKKLARNVPDESPTVPPECQAARRTLPRVVLDQLRDEHQEDVTHIYSCPDCDVLRESLARGIEASRRELASWHDARARSRDRAVGEFAAALSGAKPATSRPVAALVVALLLLAALYTFGTKSWWPPETTERTERMRPQRQARKVRQLMLVARLGDSLLVEPFTGVRRRPDVPGLEMALWAFEPGCTPRQITSDAETNSLRLEPVQNPKVTRIENEHGEPVAGAVIFWRERQRLTFSDRRGTAYLPADAGAIEIRATGYAAFNGATARKVVLKAMPVLNGVVREKFTGAGVDGAIIEARVGELGTLAFSERGGAFSISPPAAGKLRLVAHCPGYPPVVADMEKIVPGAVVLELVKKLAYRGRVIEAEGRRGVEKVPVQVLFPSGRSVSVRTDRDGRFSVESEEPRAEIVVDAGSRRCYFSAEPFWIQRREVEPGEVLFKVTRGVPLRGRLVGGSVQRGSVPIHFAIQGLVFKTGLDGEEFLFPAVPKGTGWLSVQDPTGLAAAVNSTADEPLVLPPESVGRVVLPRLVARRTTLATTAKSNAPLLAGIWQIGVAESSKGIIRWLGKRLVLPGETVQLGLPGTALSPGVVVRMAGSVRDEGGRPVADALVSARWDSFETLGRSSDTGEFELPARAEGAKWSVDKPGYTLSKIDVFRSGVEATLRLLDHPVLRVTDLHGEPVKRFRTVGLRGDDVLFDFDVFGTNEIELPLEPEELIVTAPGYYWEKVKGKFSVQLAPAPALEGKVSTETGLAPEGAWAVVAGEIASVVLIKQGAYRIESYPREGKIVLVAPGYAPSILSIPKEGGALTVLLPESFLGPGAALSVETAHGSHGLGPETAPEAHARTGLTVSNVELPLLTWWLAPRREPARLEHLPLGLYSVAEYSAEKSLITDVRIDSRADLAAWEKGGAEVTVKSETSGLVLLRGDSGVIRGEQAAGEIHFALVPPGSYEVILVRNGAPPLVRKVTLSKGKPADVALREAE